MLEEIQLCYFKLGGRVKELVATILRLLKLFKRIRRVKIERANQEAFSLKGLIAPVASLEEKMPELTQTKIS